LGPVLCVPNVLWSDLRAASLIGLAPSSTIPPHGSTSGISTISWTKRLEMSGMRPFQAG
jgi:hypothetical protein